MCASRMQQMRGGQSLTSDASYADALYLAGGSYWSLTGVCDANVGLGDSVVGVDEWYVFWMHFTRSKASEIEKRANKKHGIAG